MNKIKRFFEHIGRDKTFKYRISEEEGVLLSTHDSEKFPIENIRLEWGYTLIFQPAFSQIIKKIYSRPLEKMTMISVNRKRRNWKDTNFFVMPSKLPKKKIVLKYHVLKRKLNL